MLPRNHFISNTLNLAKSKQRLITTLLSDSVKTIVTKRNKSWLNLATRIPLTAKSMDEIEESLNYLVEDI